jgi:hypothetical protein
MAKLSAKVRFKNKMAAGKAQSSGKSRSASSKGGGKNSGS